MYPTICGSIFCSKNDIKVGGHANEETRNGPNGKNATENLKAVTGPFQSGSQHSSVHINWTSINPYGDRQKYAILVDEYNKKQ